MVVVRIVTQALAALSSISETYNPSQPVYGQPIVSTSAQDVSTQTKASGSSSLGTVPTFTSSSRHRSGSETSTDGSRTPNPTFITSSSGGTFSSVKTTSFVATRILSSTQSTANTLLIQSSSSIPQSVSNGDSLLGTLDNPTYPKYLGENSGFNSPNWTDRDAWNINPYTSSPSSGTTRYYEYTFTNGVLYPDGYRKEMLLVNNQFPGPVLEANWGDIVVVTVHNKFSGEAPQQATLHWHGVLQHKTIWYDGSPGISQCPVVPGDSFTYAWKAELYGSTWYHGHLSAHWGNGLFGPILVYGPTHVKHDIDIGPVMLSDWYHNSVEEVTKKLLEPQDVFAQIPSDNNLINGKNPLACPSGSDRTVCLSGATYAKFVFQPGKSHLLRLINTGVQAVQKFSIDGHKITIVANDFVPVEPYQVNMVTLGIGQRTDIIVEADQDPRQSYWMRSTATCAETKNPDAKAIIYYANKNNASYASVISDPTTQAQPDNSAERNAPCGNDPLELTKPIFQLPVKTPSVVKYIEATFGRNSTGSWVWYMDNNSYLTDFNNPSLQLLSNNNAQYLLNDQRRNPYFVPDNATSYRFILQNSSPSPHPIHYHGHNIQILYVSTTPWSSVEASALESRIVRPSNPQRRDVQQVPAGGYLVLQTNADNAGAWGLHCHMAFHIGAGFFFEVIEGKDKLLGKPIPDDIVAGCQRWKEWNNANQKQAKVWDSGQRL